MFDHPIKNRISSDNDLRTMGDFNLVNKLLASPRYDIPEALRAKVIGAAARALGAGEPAKIQMAAAKVILAADAHNLAIAKMSIPKHVVHHNVRDMSDEELEEATKTVLSRISAKKTLPILDQ